MASAAMAPFSFKRSTSFCPVLRYRDAPRMHEEPYPDEMGGEIDSQWGGQDSRHLCQRVKRAKEIW